MVGKINEQVEEQVEEQVRCPTTSPPHPLPVRKFNKMVDAYNVEEVASGYTHPK